MMQEVKEKEAQNLEVMDNWLQDQTSDVEESEPSRMPLFNEFFEERD